ncbi:hypothetical protein G7074_01600 [Pedobacter sp. HDW13]|uniref:hypothetical protein n=1 Tax=unclassified Pedobacter TaxID=2628915 RepID=UPI000F59CF91|nr:MULTISPECIES: hypothetical protein [unclassified Pedobacter]QIL38086.1 hypothetical protein G7074_01600 [Pedobacter sp. HDW13]
MDKELIEHIKSQLQNHEEQYPAGAWERFSGKEEKKRRIAFWPLWAAAALIFVFGGVFFALNTQEQKNDTLSVKPHAEQHNNSNTKATADKNIEIKENAAKVTNPNGTNEALLSINRNTPNTSDIKPLAAESTNYAALQIPEETHLTNNNLLNNTLKAINLVNFSVKPIDILSTQKKTASPTVQKLKFEDLLAQDSRDNQNKPVSKTGQPSKWTPDVYVAPSMGNDNKVTMNYGVSLSYAIANKLSISSGVSYASISTTESLNAQAPQSLSGKNLTSVDAKVRGINIPLELKYNISDKLYTGVGISALAVINNSQQNNYIVNQVQNVSYSTANGLADQKMLIVQEKTTEPQPENNIDPDKYIGFYNFSLGYKQKISKKNNISIEPFLRLPMKTFSKENLNLTNGGLRLKIDF